QPAHHRQQHRHDHQEDHYDIELVANSLADIVGRLGAVHADADRFEVLVEIADDAIAHRLAMLVGHDLDEAGTPRLAGDTGQVGVSGEPTRWLPPAHFNT